MTKELNKVKAFSLNIPIESWQFMKVKAAELGISMTRLIILSIQNHQKYLKIIEEYKNDPTRRSVMIDADELDRIMKALKDAQDMIENLK